MVGPDKTAIAPRFSSHRHPGFACSIQGIEQHFIRAASVDFCLQPIALDELPHNGLIEARVAAAIQLQSHHLPERACHQWWWCLTFYGGFVAVVISLAIRLG